MHDLKFIGNDISEIYTLFIACENRNRELNKQFPFDVVFAAISQKMRDRMSETRKLAKQNKKNTEILSAWSIIIKVALLELLSM